MSNTSLILKALAIWFILVILAIGNAAIREMLLAPLFGAGAALPLSGLLLALLIFLTAYFSVPLFTDNSNNGRNKIYFWVGAIWFALTLLFELMMGRYIAGKPWREVIEVFNMLEGNLFIVALLATAVSPWLAAQHRRPAA